MSVMRILKRAAGQFSTDGAFTLAAALSFYLALSMAPLVMVCLAIAGQIWGNQAASEQLVQDAQRLVGTQGAQSIQAIVANVNRPGSSTSALAVGIVAALLGATGVFVQLQSSLNTIWNVMPTSGRGLTGYLSDRLWSLLMVLLVGAMLLASLILSTALSTVNARLGAVVNLRWGWQLADVAGSLALATLLFAAVVKTLPYAEIRWRHVWLGAAVTSVLFNVGKFLIGLYLGYSGMGSAYGAAGSLIVVLVWVYYSSLIMFFGAELTQAYVREAGEPIRPSAHAVPLTSQKRERCAASGTS